MSIRPPPIHEAWKLDSTGKLVSLPWILWLQQMSAAGDISSVGSDDLASFAAMFYNQNSSTVLSNDSEMLTWMSF